MNTPTGWVNMNWINTLRKEISAIVPEKRQIRQFGWMWFVILTFLVPLWKWYSGTLRGESVDVSVSLAGVLVLLLAYGFPKLLNGLYRIWMGLGLVMGLVFGNLVVALVFYAVMTPIGLLNRMRGKPFMPLKPDKNLTSYWKIRGENFTKSDFERQF